MGDMKKYIVEKAPPNIYYIPNFITEEEEQYLLHQVNSAPKPKWTQLSNRRLQNWGGLPHPKGMVAEEIPQWLKIYTEKVAALGLFGDKMPNHILVNEYLAGQGIMPHEDGPLFFPVVSTISLGSHTVLEFYRPLNAKNEYREDVPEQTSFDDRFVTSILLEPRSLVFVCDDMYKTYLHGISERTFDTITESIANIELCEMAKSVNDKLTRTSRVSLTIRHVPKVLKAKIMFGKK
ncbi:alpha-ketoglutarate-dependent dioxygenase alkB homolog 6-like isoform X2 [Ostrea edulis]|uniref:alpha-ketoglutarate-dependent dioxygenase alkB homolog 6-like isoform X2 n=1 Tax=Ostrea edulis TaxID=37623 RepID=UPI0024AFF205|nr:alpha-ketoglutarate-dependent dioxygenase alkB homolog 6-like isoform X2 [Ostrea edulis]